MSRRTMTLLIALLLMLGVVSVPLAIYTPPGRVKLGNVAILGPGFRGRWTVRKDPNIAIAVHKDRMVVLEIGKRGEIGSATISGYPFREGKADPWSVETARVTFWQGLTIIRLSNPRQSEGR